MHLIKVMDSQDSMRRARRSLDVAEHMLNSTYPLVEDPKLILAVSEDLFTALLSSVFALVGRDGADGIERFRREAAGLGFTEEDVGLLDRLQDIIREHEESPVEFARKDKFVICDDDYACDVVSVEDMKNYLFKARLFVEKAEAEFGSREIAR